MIWGGMIIIREGILNKWNSMGQIVVYCTGGQVRNPQATWKLRTWNISENLNSLCLGMLHLRNSPKGATMTRLSLNMQPPILQDFGGLHLLQVHHGQISKNYNNPELFQAVFWIQKHQFLSNKTPPTKKQQPMAWNLKSEDPSNQRSFLIPLIGGR